MGEKWKAPLCTITFRNTLKHRVTGNIDILSRNIVTGDPSSCRKGHFRSWKVTSSFSGITFDRDHLEQWKHHRCVQAFRRRSTDMQHDPFGSVHDLDLRSNFQHDLSRLKYISFDASRQEKHDACKINVVALLSQKLLQKNYFRKKRLFWSFCSRRPNRWC